ncbi:MAG: BlaI/MecI/CopY family transcriptional regulator [Anaerorhabdus sp.]
MKKCSSTEFELLELVWSSSQPILATELYSAILNRKGNKLSTKAISVYINRMVKKEVLTQTMQNGKYYYTAVSKIDYQRYLINESVTESTGKSFSELLLAFVGKEVSNGSLEEINNVIEKMTKK